MKFDEYFETIKKKPVTFRHTGTEYIIDGQGTWWGLYRRVSGAGVGCPICEDVFLQVGVFANTFSTDECVCHYKVLGKQIGIKVKIDDFKLIDNGK